MAVNVAFSRFSIFIFVFLPLGAVKLPGLLSDLITRWQGIISGMGFFAMAEPIARAALGWLIFWANWL